MKASQNNPQISGEAMRLHGILLSTSATANSLVSKVPASREHMANPILSEDFQKAERKVLASPSLSRVILYINKNYAQRLTLDIVAKHVFLNKTYISQLFSRHLGISFLDYLENVRLSNACVLLQTTNMSIAEIAKATGYSTSSYFTKVFKKRAGVVPSQYRANALEDPNFSLIDHTERVGDHYEKQIATK